ncbi:MAG: ATP-binding protein [Bacteroidota bacterium]
MRLSRPFLSRHAIYPWIIPFLIFAPITVPAQLDSLIQAVETMSDDQEKADLLNNLAYYTHQSDPALSIRYSAKGRQLSKQLGYLQGEGKSYYTEGAALKTLAQYPQALSHIDTAIGFFERVNDQRRLAICLGTKGLILNEIQQYTEAVNFHLQALAINQELKDTLAIAVDYNNLSVCFLRMNQRDYAQTYLKEAVDLLKPLQEFAFISRIYGNYSESMLDLASQKQYIDSALAYAAQSGDDYYLLGNLHNLASYYIQTEEWNEAETYILQEISLAETYNEQVNQIKARLLYADILLNDNQLQKSDEQIGLVMEMAKAQLSLTAPSVDAYFLKSEIEQKKGNDTEALYWLNTYVRLEDSLTELQAKQDIKNQSAQFQIEARKKAVEAEKANTETAQRLTQRILIFSGFLLAFLVLIYQWYINQQKNQKRQAEMALQAKVLEAEKLQELDQFKSRFFTNISHELRTPLTLIISPLADVLPDLRSVTIRQKLSLVQQNAQRLLSLVNEIMDLSKIESGRLQLQLGSTDFTLLIRRIFLSFSSMADAKEIQYTLDSLEDAVFVETDIDKVEKIVQNLLSNAIKFTPKGGAVHIKVQQEKAGFLFSVKDTGLGIPEADLPRIFDRFFQVQEAHAPLQGGTGIGLALTKELTHLLEGEIHVRSEWGKGSTFEVYLPMKASTPPQEPEIQEERSSDYTLSGFAPLLISGEKPRILLVEDNPEMSQYLANILAEDYQVAWAGHGQQALQKIRSQSFDAILSDVMMPIMDGFELRAQLNEHPQWKWIPFVLLTARHLETDKIRGFQLGIDDYLTKPFSTAELKARLHSLIQNKIARETFLREDQQVAPEVEMSTSQQMLKKAEKTVLDNLDNPQFGVEALASYMNYSAKNLRRIIKKETGLTTVNFILEIRLQKARELLENRRVASVFDAQIQVGISSNSYFTKKFTERFGKNPREVAKA